MIRLVRAEFLKLRTTQVWFWLLFAIIVLSGLLMVAGILPSQGARHASDVPGLLTAPSTFVLFGPCNIVAFILGVLGVTTEFRYQTITPTLLQTPSRWAVVSAKMIAYAIIGALYAVIAVVAELIVAVPLLKSKHVTVHFGDSHVQHSIVAVFGVVALFGIVGLGIGALIRNQIAAVVIGLITLSVLESIIVAIPVVKHAYPYTPGGAALAIARTNESASINGVHVLSTGGGVIMLLLWAFVPAILGASITMNRDIT